MCCTKPHSFNRIRTLLTNLKAGNPLVNAICIDTSRSSPLRTQILLRPSGNKNFLDIYLAFLPILIVAISLLYATLFIHTSLVLQSTQFFSIVSSSCLVNPVMKLEQIPSCSPDLNISSTVDICFSYASKFRTVKRLAWKATPIVKLYRHHRAKRTLTPFVVGNLPPAWPRRHQ